MQATKETTKSEAPQARRGPSLETRGLCKVFGAFRALEDVSLRIAPGSFHALLG